MFCGCFCGCVWFVVVVWLCGGGWWLNDGYGGVGETGILMIFLWRFMVDIFRLLLFSDLWMSLFCEGFFCESVYLWGFSVIYGGLFQMTGIFSCINEMRVFFFCPNGSVVRFYWRICRSRRLWICLRRLWDRQPIHLWCCPSPALWSILPNRVFYLNIGTPQPLTCRDTWQHGPGGCPLSLRACIQVRPAPAADKAAQFHRRS